MNENQKSPKKPLTDEEIVALFWKRNEKAIEETDKKYGRYLYAIAYNIVHDSLDSEECLNDTYHGTWNKIPPTRPRVLGAFLSRIMRNIAVDKFRSNTAQKRIPSEYIVALDELDECIATEDESVEKDYDIRQISRILNDFLHKLSARREYIFVCRYYYSDKISDIAESLGLKESTVSRELSLMRRELKDALEKEGYVI
ncbi:MAG: sigma-70 family RNA polymerase sigma factor [Clostridia bacterium]|nr:sigma-70 family RNA polymerase sigma factor [Clostridia bacterium]